MQQVFVSLPTAASVQCFVKTLTPLYGDFEIISGKYLLDARSLMGLFSLDLAHPLALRVYNASPENLAAIQPFLSNAEVNHDA